MGLMMRFNCVYLSMNISLLGTRWSPMWTLLLPIHCPTSCYTHTHTHIHVSSLLTHAMGIEPATLHS